jgi:hypothetical protein
VIPSLGLTHASLVKDEILGSPKLFNIHFNGHWLNVDLLCINCHTTSSQTCIGHLYFSLLMYSGFQNEDSTNANAIKFFDETY